ncbi:MAG: flavodoxin family protein [Pseudolysinimonas sp.]|jgi:multimeric flavodoxin WrbA|uniref:flavodoxin family protein n=1 Tax=Pseudolysinimonas sp. TaxID=2680009 RepID=UPI003C70B06F
MTSYGDLSALYLNCTLTRSPHLSNTHGLMDRTIALAEKQGVAVESVRLVDFDVAPGVQPDMRVQGWAADAWPDELWPKVRDADILVIGTPIWLGEVSSVCRRLIERLYAMTDETNAAGQPVFYGKVAGAIATGNEDGVKNVNRHLLYALQHIGYTIPPAAETGWIGEIGPGPSYLDDDSGGPQSDYTNRTATAMTWNLLHLARLLKDAGGIPAVGNVAARWEAGERWGFDAG